ncbi:MAG TPA: F0F1 ATP synthase subunit B [Haloplasmataceae bacterium]
MQELSQKLSELVQGGLFPNPITFIVQIISTIILFILLKKLVWKPMREFLDKRSAVIVDELDSAKRAREEAERIKLEYESKLSQAKKDALEMLDNAREQAELIKEEIINDAHKEAEYIINNANKQIEIERNKAEQELKTEIVDIAFSAMEKVLSENMDSSKNRELIDKFINEIGE